VLNFWYEICNIFSITKEGHNMKKFRYIIPVILVVASSCTSQLYTGTADDDLYYRPSDEPVVAVQTATPAGTTDQYYDNMLAGDTLIADDYVPSASYLSGTGADASVVNNYYGASAAERIYLFNDGFYPYWDYYSPYSLNMSFGFGYGLGMSFGWGYPYYGYGYGGYNPYYPYYGYGYGGYYDPYWGYGSGYPYYGYGGYPPYYGSSYPPYYNDGSSHYVSRRGGYSTTTRGSYTTEGDGRVKSGIPTESSYSRRAGSASPSASSATSAAQSGTSTATRRPATATEKSTYTRSSSVPNSGLTTGQGYTRRDPSAPSAQTGTQSTTQTRSQTGTQTRTGSDTECEQTTVPDHRQDLYSKL
jgi:hypothetical protein